MNEELLQSYLDADPNIQNKYTFDEFASMQQQANEIPALQSRKQCPVINF